MFNFFKNSYLRTLKECSKIAKEEYRKAINKIELVKKDLTVTQKMLIETQIEVNKSGINDQSIYDTLYDINKVTKSLNDGFNSLEKSFSNKAENLSDFTITLFGRTKSGKSTIREALTKGDGGTIGKGAQRTTKDVMTYHWNHLRIIDTPGFDAYKGSEDEKIAFSQIDKTDLILFLVTNDSIEESEFDKLACIRRENKPVIILLNILHDINNPIKRKQILNNPKKYVSIEAIEGHLSRLQFLSKKYFDIHNISVIPIHALSAFECNSIYGQEKEQLYSISNFEYFSDFLIDTIKNSGKQKRVQTFRDSYIFYLENHIKYVYEYSCKELISIARLLKIKQEELKNWFDKFIPNKNDEIERKIDKLFQPLFYQLDTFVDQYIEDSNFGQKWKNRLNETITQEKIKSIQERIQNEMNEYLKIFYKEFSFDLNLTITKIESEISNIMKDNTGRIFRWSGATISTVSSGIFLGIKIGAITNSWNPIGWGLALVAIGFGIISWLWGGDDTKNFNREKAQLKTKMLNNLEDLKRKYRGALKAWFYKDITRGLQKKIKNDLYNQVKIFDELIKKYKSIINDIKLNVNQENIKLINRLLELQNIKNFNKNSILMASRIQGLLTKIVVNKPIFDSVESHKDFEKIYGERIIEINKEDDEIKFLQNVLNTDYNEIKKIYYDVNTNTYICEVKENYAGKIYGLQGCNLKTAQDIINKKIHIKVV